MSLLQSLNIKARLALGYAVLVALVVLIAALATQALRTSNADFENQVVRVGRLKELGNDVLDAANARAVAARNLVISSDPAEAKAEVALIQEAHQKMQTQLQALRAAVAATEGASTRLKAAVDQVEKTEAAYGPIALEITRLGAAGQRDEAIAKINKECRPLLTALIKNLNDYLQVANEMSTQNVASSQSSYEAMRNGMLALGLVAAAVAGVLGTYTTRSITEPLGQAMAAARDFAEGNLSVAVRAQGRDEIAQMLEALERMRHNLTGIVASVRQGADGVATASVQIAQGNQDLSGRTESQASALQQTASSMEQLNATVKQNADNALQANQLARSASDVARQGGDVVSQVVDTMRGINDSSKRIADIIGVIDGIAFQTNILALNAAVEAARAGEQGRGFAVVAGEVRSLAQRSAEAAKEIKSLISDSVGRVTQGSQLADRAGSTMQEIVASIGRVTDIMGEISAASSEQSGGVEQVNAAVSQMDQATQQNAALVEEMAAAASSMSGQARELVQSVAVFRLG